MGETTLYEAMGGVDTVHALAAEHYRRCQTDPVLVEVFGTEPRPEHAEHLAAWLAEVFGGPTVYTDTLGGHGALLRHHANLSITEPQRARFVEVFLEAADAVGVPADERLRTRLHEYLEWGSAIAREVSVPGASVESDQPVPRWGWS